MNAIETIFISAMKPKEKQTALVEAVCGGAANAKELIDFFISASYVDKGSCADAMKHIAERNPEILEPYIDTLLPYINHKAPRVKWGVSEAVGSCAAKYPDKSALAIPYLLRNTAENEINTTVVRWCAAYGLSEIALHCVRARKKLMPEMKSIAEKEKNNGVRNVYLKTLQNIEGNG
ncbi:MAG: hypothetical protein JW768_05175 [Chitinispirillaceae bacterium]|nr:hypothetical protein [Chitinispirillaceae bacterium]